MTIEEIETPIARLKLLCHAQSGNPTLTIDDHFEGDYLPVWTHRWPRRASPNSSPSASGFGIFETLSGRAHRIRWSVDEIDITIDDLRIPLQQIASPIELLSYAD